MTKKRFPGTDKLNELTFYSLLSVLQGGMWLQNDIEKFLKPFGLSHGRFSILLTLLENGDSDVIHKDISSFLGKSLPTITKMLKRLEKDNLVEVKQSEKDSRMKNFHLSPEGQQLIDEIIPAYNLRLERIGSNLSIDEKAQLMSLIAKLNYPEHGQKIKVFNV
jgi:DNA-binding MarR family transcriptional regulator